MNTDSTTWDVLRDLAPAVAVKRPNPGKRVLVLQGRQQGAKGIVQRHQIDRYSDAFRYGSDANLHLREMRGTYGFVVLVRFDDGRASKWIKADQVEIID